jgi:carboxyl-terminal processing protease
VLLAIDAWPVEPAVALLLQQEGREAERRLRAARAVMARLHGEPGVERELSYRHPDGTEERRKIACRLPAATQSLGNLVDVPVRVETRMLDDAVGYLAFNVWMVPLLASHIEPGLAQLRASGMKALLIDLRQNPGGVGAMAIPVARLLVRQEAHLGRLRMREMVQEYRVEGRPDAFDGPVVLLIDEGTASTSEIFAVGLRGIGRASIVGASTSAGMALPSQIEQLPDGGQLQYVVGEYDGPGGEAAEGRGVTPDRLVEESAADYAAGRDPVLEAGIALANDKLQGGN